MIDSLWRVDWKSAGDAERYRIVMRVICSLGEHLSLPLVPDGVTEEDVCDVGFSVEMNGGGTLSGAHSLAVRGVVGGDCDDNGDLWAVRAWIFFYVGGVSVAPHGVECLVLEPDDALRNWTGRWDFGEPGEWDGFLNPIQSENHDRVRGRAEDD